MYNIYTGKEKFYTPKFSAKASITIRRLAWAFDLPMTKTVDLIINELSYIFSSSDICAKCKDKTECNSCAFSGQAAAEKSAITA